MRLVGMRLVLTPPLRSLRTFIVGLSFQVNWFLWIMRASAVIWSTTIFKWVKVTKASKFVYGVAFAKRPRSPREGDRFCRFRISLEHVFTMIDNLHSHGIKYLCRNLSYWINWTEPNTKRLIRSEQEKIECRKEL